MNIAIIGMGLIGTSLGLALRSADEATAPLGKITVVGYDRDARATADARGRLAIDRVARNVEDAVRDAQVVVLAAPAQALRELFVQLAPVLAHGTVITDVASTKAQVVEWAQELLPRTVEFIGGHPMAGKEQRGSAAAETKLFKDAIYCLTPTAHTRQEAIDVVEALVEQVGAKPYYIDATEHDGYVAGVSHLPFLLSTMLVEVTSNSPGWKEMAALAATGFRDVSRLASGDAEMHRDICLTNRESITRWIDATVSALLDVRDQLEANDGDALLAVFEHAQQKREQWLNTRPNLRPGEEAFENISGVAVERPRLFGRLGGGSKPNNNKPR